MMTYTLQFVAVPSSATPIDDISVIETHEFLAQDDVIRILDEAMDDAMDLVADIADIYVGNEKLLVSSISLNQYGDAYLAQCVQEAVDHLEEVQPEVA